jgi:hypothetical protein
MIDLGRFDTVSASEEGRWLEPVDFNGKSIGFKIKLHGPDSRLYLQLKQEAQRDGYRIMADIANGLEPRESKLSQEDQDILLCSRLSITWQSTDDDDVVYDGKPFPCTLDNAKVLYSKAAAIREQVLRFIGSRRNFTKPESVD